VPALITGGSGFAGRHLLAYLASQQPDLALHATSLGGDPPIDTPLVQLHTVNLTNRDHVRDLIDHLRPSQIYHLAAQSSPRYSFVDPWATLENNIRAQLNLILACLDLHLAPRILIVSSAEIYQPSDQPINEGR
jgi:nucleoside-diphosphate-sugar epimerase